MNGIDCRRITDLQITDDMRNFILSHEEEFNDQQFQRIYDEWEFAFDSNNLLTDLLLGAGINPLPQMATIPGNWLKNYTAKRFTVPENVKTLLPRAFNSCHLTELTIEGQGVRVQEKAFWNCSIDTLNLPEKAQLEIRAFDSVDVGTLNLKRFDKVLFNFMINSSVRNPLILPEGLKRINSYGFERSELAEVYLPTTVKKLEGYCFSDIPELKITYMGTVDQWNKIDKADNWAGNCKHRVRTADGTILVNTL